MVRNTRSSLSPRIQFLYVAVLVCLSLTLPASVSAQTGNITYVYDDLGRLVAVVDPAGDTAVYTYDAVGNLLSISRFSSSVLSILHFTPSQGPVGASVTIYGTSFSTTASQNTVTFNGVAATVISADSTRIVTSVPSGATTGTISVTTPGGSVTSSTPFTVSTSTAPTITSFTPTIGTAGTAVTITGTNFDTTASNDWVTFNNRYGLVSSVTSTSISTSVPSLATSGRISVATPAGKAISAADFFVPPSPFATTDVEVTGRMTFGENKTVTISTANKIGLILFDGEALQRVSLKINSFSMTGMNLTIFNPDGTTLSSNAFYANGGLVDTPLLPATGTYTILVDPQGSNTGSVNFTLYNASDVTGTITPGGASVTITTTTPGQNARLTFTATAGQRVSLQLTNSTFTGCYAVHDAIKAPDGASLASSGLCNATGYVDTVVLPVAGYYTVLVDPQGATTGSQTLLLNNVPPDVTGSITPGGASVTVTTTTPGQNGILSFSGTAGQRVSLNLSNSTFTGCYAVNDIIKKPDGTNLASIGLCGASEFLDTVTLPVTGSYSILIDPQGTTTGSQTLLLNNVPSDVTGSITPGGASVTVTTTTPGQNAILSFSGTAGQRVSLKLSNSTFTGCYAVNNIIKKPDGTNLASIGLCGASEFLDTVTLPVTGSYSILIDPQGSTTGSETLLLLDVPADVTTSITPGGSSVTLTTTTAGQNGRATFSGTANQRVSLNVTGVSITGGYHNWATVSIKKPDGSTLASGTFDNGGGFIDVQTLPTTGTYTVLVDMWDSATGSVTLTLYDVPADSSVSVTPGGAAVTVSNTTPGQNGQATFSGTANQRVSLQITGVTLTGGYHNWVNVSIKNPDGSTLVSGTYDSGGGYIDAQTLPATGTYAIRVDPWDTAVGSVTLTLNDVPAEATGTITVGGSALTLTTTVPGQNAKPTFSGTANQQVSVSLTSNTMGAVTVSLLKPDGTSLTSVTSSASSFSLATTTLPTTSTYSVKIDPSGTNIGSITVAVADITSSATLQADYRFQNTRNSSVGSPPALVDLGTNSFVTDTVDSTSTTVLSFSQNNGLSFSPTTGVIPSSSYSIVMLFSFTQTSGYRRIADFKNATSDNGQYQQNGHLYFYPSGYGSPVSIPANTYVQVVITRDTTGTVTGYVDGVQQFQFSDTTSLGVIDSNNTLRFFRDDNNANEASAGAVARIRLYNGALTATQVAALSRLP